ncbi:MAG: beta-glucosidase BglX [[Chlorobium] sp. 445]|nr:MAG: beta-glucosidase BglX [[Chlorobium] sp. 445]
MRQLLTALFMLCTAVTQAQLAEQTLERRIDSLLAQMTLEEKLGQLNQLAGDLSNFKRVAGILPHQYELIRQGKVGSMLMVYGAELTRKAQEMALQSRLKIPLLFGFDVIHGFRTTFPIPLAESCSWDLALIERSARIAATEAAAAGLHWTFAPMVDIARDPRWGRIIEGAGEDPYLASLIAAARVRGFQGETLSAPNTILACAKHFAAYGAAEGGRDYNTVDISERTLREIYLPPFKAAVDAGVETIMASFNEIAGIPSSINSMLMTDILRREWNFKGFVVSDWESINEVHVHGAAKTTEEAALLALRAGVDMDMEGELYVNLANAVRAGKISEQTLNAAVRRVLRAKFKLGLFDDPFRYCDVEREKATLLNPDHREAAREMARKSIVLLKNDQDLLPLRKDLKTIAVVGGLATAARDMLGEWEMVGRAEDVITPLDGVKKKVSNTTRVLYAKGCEVSRSRQAMSKAGFAEAVRIAKQADVVIAVVGESADMTGEAHSRASIDLPGVQEDLLKELHKTGKPLVVVVTSGRPLALVWAAENATAIVQAWHLGVEAGNAIADILFGDENPSAKLTISVPRSVGQIPIYYNHKNTGRPINPQNPADRYKSRYIDIENSPLYPFGYGLSYSKFEYRDLRVSQKEFRATDTVRISVEVINTSTRDGEEVVQLYVRDDYASITRPVKELKGFQKVYIKAGERKTVEFKLSAKDLMFLGRDFKPVLEAGSFSVFVGSNSRDTLQEKIELLP